MRRIFMVGKQPAKIMPAERIVLRLAHPPKAGFHARSSGRSSGGRESTDGTRFRQLISLDGEACVI